MDFFFFCLFVFSTFVFFFVLKPCMENVDAENGPWIISAYYFSLKHFVVFEPHTRFHFLNCCYTHCLLNLLITRSSRTHLTSVRYSEQVCIRLYVRYSMSAEPNILSRRTGGQTTFSLALVVVNNSFLGCRLSISATVD